jgi:hypothetical protein
MIKLNKRKYSSDYMNEIRGCYNVSGTAFFVYCYIRNVQKINKYIFEILKKIKFMFYEELKCFLHQ